MAAGGWQSTAVTCISLAFAALALLHLLLRQEPARVSTADIEAIGGSWTRAADGRALEYFTCGAEAGAMGTVPLYLQHGYGHTGGSHVTRDWCGPAAARGLRIIAPTMPGFGLSDSYPVGRVRTLSDSEWPADVAAVLAHAGVGASEGLYVAATSAGGVHAASFVLANQRRVRGVALFTPTTTLAVEAAHTAEAGGMSRVTRALRLALAAPVLGDALAWAMSRMTDMEGRVAGAPDVAAAYDKMRRLGGEHARRRAEAFADGDRAVAHTWRGWSDNVHVLNDDLPFHLADIRVAAPAPTDGKGGGGGGGGGGYGGRVVPFVVSSAPDDTTNPPSMQRYWRDAVPGARLIDFPAGWGHLHLMQPETIEAMFTAMLQLGGEART